MKLSTVAIRLGLSVLAGGAVATVVLSQGHGLQPGGSNSWEVAPSGEPAAGTLLPDDLQALREAEDKWDYGLVQQRLAVVRSNGTALAASDYIRIAHIYRVRGHAAEGLALINEGFRHFPSVDTALEIVGSAREAGEITTAQQMLTRVLSERMTPEQRQVASGNVWELSKIKWQFDFELNPKPVNYPENFIQQRGYYEFFSRPSTPYQTTEVTVLGNMSRKEEVTDSANNRIVRIYPQYWSIPVKVRMVVTKTPVALKLATEDVPADKLPADIRPYLGKSNQIDPTGPIAQSIAQKLRGKNRAETIENIREWVMREVKYQNPVLPGEANKRDSETVLSRKRGYCWEIGRAMTAVLRAAGIPARRMFMINVYPERGDDIDFSSALPAWCHVMAEFWDPKAGWSPCQNRPSSVVAMRYIPLASEMMVEQNPDGTVERVANETFYGNHESPTKKAVCNSVSLKVLSAFLR